MKQPPEKPPSDIDMGWLVAYLLVGTFLIFAILSFPSVQAIACSPGETHCWREWISATSGWGAAVAAAGSIYFLRQQLKDTAAHNRTQITLGHLGNTASAISTASAGLLVVDIFEEYLESYDGKNPDGLNTYGTTTCDYLIQLLNSEDLKKFETTFGPPKSLPRGILSKMIEGALTFMNEYDDIEQRTDFIQRFMPEHCERAKDYFTALKADAELASNNLA